MTGSIGLFRINQNRKLFFLDSHFVVLKRCKIGGKQYLYSKINVMLKKLFYPIVFFSLSLTSCSPTFYRPVVHNIPVLEKKGDQYITASYSSASSGLYGATDGGELQYSRAVSDNWAVQTNLSFYNSPKRNERVDNTPLNFSQGYNLEAAVGYYNSTHPVQSYQVWGGVATASANNLFSKTYGPAGSRNLGSGIFKLFIEPAFMLRSKNFDGAFSTKITMSNYSNPVYLGFDPLLDANLKELVGTNPHLTEDFILTFRLGSENIKLQFQLGTSVNLNNTELTLNQFNNKLFFSFGGSFKL
jgi:hypothetical protein